MELKQSNLTTTKTGRVFTAGNHENPQDIWILCHGYAQLANDFLEKLFVLNSGEALLVSAEGLHRFYSKGFSGRVGASWMTKEDRQSDIEDYVQWLNKVYRNFVPEGFTGRVILLGFSQGGATVCRWLERSGNKVDHLVLYAATFPPDVVPAGNFSRNINGRIIYALGSEDEFITKNDKATQLEILRSSGKQVSVIDFEGKHEIQAEVLMRIREEIQR